MSDELNDNPFRFRDFFTSSVEEGKDSKQVRYYVVQRGWSEAWLWHWLIIDPKTRDVVGLLFEEAKAMEIELPSV